MLMIIRLTADQQHDEEKHMMCWAHLPASPPCPGQRCTRRPVSACRGSAHNPTPRTCGPWARRGGSFPPAAGRWGWRRRPPRRHRLEGRPVRTRRPRRRPPRWTWTHTTWPLHTRTARRRCAPPHGPWTTWYVYYVVWLLLFRFHRRCPHPPTNLHAMTFQKLANFRSCSYVAEMKNFMHDAMTHLVP